MATLMLMCGLPGAGKTTLAKWLEVERNALRLTPDDWILALGIDPYDEPRRATLEGLFAAVAARSLALGVSVILDFGFWSRRERDDYRVRAADLGAAFEIHYAEASPEVLVARLSARNAALGPGDVPVTAETLLSYFQMFEPPGPDELARSEPPQLT